MGRIIRYFRTIAILTPALLACVLMPSSVAADKTASQAAPVLRSACEVDYPPFSIVHPDGRADGFSVELLRAAAGVVGREVTFRTGPWSEVRGWLERGEVDALPLVGRTPEREALFDFTVPYLTMHGALVVRKDTQGIRTLSDLRGRCVGVMKGDNAEELLRRKDRGIEIVTTPTFIDAFQALSDGRCDAVVVQRLVALRLLAESGLKNLRIVDRPIEDFRQDFSFAVKEGDRDTLALLNEGLALVVADGTHRRLHAKWFAHLELPPNRPIVVGGDYNYPPFEFLDEKGRPAGFTVELTRAIAREMNLDIRFRLGPWSEAVESLRRGEVDVVQGIFYSDERNRTLDFSPHYFTSHYAGVTGTGDGSPPETFADLAGRRVAVQAGDAILDALADQAPDARVVTVETQEDVLRAVVEGGADVGLAVRLSALYFIDKNDWSGLRLGKQSLFAGDYCYAVPHGHDALLAEFSEGLRVLKHTGEFRRIHEKWLGTYEPGIPTRRVLKYIALAAGPILLIAVLALLWSWSLRRQVAFKTRQVREATELQRALVACSPVAIYSIDAQGIVQSWNASAEKMFGWKDDEVIGAPLPIVPEEKQEEFAELRRQGSTFTDKELLCRRKDGTQFPISLSAGPIYGSGGEAIGIMAAAEDITERRRAEQALHDSEKRYRRLFEAAHDGILILDAETGKVVDVNPFLTRLLGYPYDDFVGKHLWDIGTFKDIASSKDAFRLLQREEGIRYENLPLETADGRLAEVEFISNVYLVDDLRVIQCNIRDITDRKRAEARIEHLNRVLRAVRNVNHLITHEKDREALLRQTCDMLIETRGYRSAWIALLDGDSGVRTVAESGIGEAFEPMRKALEGGELPACCRQALAESDVIVTHNTATNCADCSLSNTYRDTVALTGVLAHSGRDYGVLVVALPAERADDPDEQHLFQELAGDIGYALYGIETEEQRRQVEAGLRESEAKYRALFETSGDGILIADIETRQLRYANPAACRFLGYAEPELLQMKIEDVAPPDALPRGLPDFHRQVRGESTLAVDIPCLRKDGEIVYADINDVRITVDGRDCIAGFFRDITPRKKAEKEREQLQSQLLQSQKIESVGRLAGGIAHDFNNILTGISGFTQFALETLPEAHESRQDLDEVLKLSQRAATLTRQLLAFSRRQPLQPEVLDLNHLVRDMTKMLGRLIGEHIELAFTPCEDLGRVNADPGQLEQVLMNLAVNARDAMPDGGKLTIETANTELDADYASTHHEVTAGPHVLLAVTDTGCGMDAEVQERIFEPFFTTKERGQGTGLGLPTVYGIVKQHGGHVWVYSEPGRGTTFKVYLPRAFDAEEQAAPKTAPETVVGTETLLVVEDENAVRRVAKRFLEDHGYHVLTVSTPSQADEVLAARGGEIALLLTDVVLPERSGRELYEDAKPRHPHLKVVYMSGYTDDSIAHQGVLEAGTAFIQKPFTSEALARKVRDTLKGENNGDE